MPKYYVQCGLFEMVLSAESTEDAALAAIDRTLQNHLWIYDDPGLSERDCHDHLMLEALMHLPPSIRVSQRGFGSERPDDDSQLIGTPETILRWHVLMSGLSRMFTAVGLMPRPICSLVRVSAGAGERHDEESRPMRMRRPR